MGSENEEHHVHFAVNQDSFEHSNDIIYQKHGSKLDIHLGFLQINHRYRMNLFVNESLLNFKIESGKSKLNLGVDENVVPNIHVKFLGIKEIEKDYELIIEFFAHKEKLLKEEITVINLDNKEEKQKIIFHARVLGRGKGTPMLRNGIHCIEVIDDEESEASDWQGFTKRRLSA